MRNSTKKKVYKYGLDGKFIVELESLRAAAKDAGIAASAISRCINDQQLTCGGFQWRAEKHQQIPPVKPYSRGKAKKSSQATITMSVSDIDTKSHQAEEVQDVGIITTPGHREYGNYLVRIGKVEIYFKPGRKTVEEIVKKYNERHSQHNKPRTRT